MPTPQPRKMPLRRKLIFTIDFAIIFGILSAVICNEIVVRAAHNKLYSDTNVIPANKVGILLGTAKSLANGTPNLFFTYRIKAAAELYRAGKVENIVVSGDNGRSTYDEPTAMKEALIAEGVDSTHIYLDYAGFRTFDSVVRLKEIFDQNRATVISQKFHNQRAIYIANRLGIDLIGYNAQDVSKFYGFKTMLRERFARVKVVLDFLLGVEPRFLGEKVLIK